jgi:UDP-N-acetyl-D-mannosaminuronate dehydrogenase
MPDYTAARIADLLNAAGKPIHRSRFLVVGVAYKPNVADDRESPAWDVLANLAARGADLVIHDPVVGAERVRRRGFRAVDALDDLDGYDIAVVLTDHDAVDLTGVADRVPIVFDTRGAFRRRGIAANHVTTL